MIAYRASGYAELAVTTNFSFLRGSSHPEECVAQAARLRLAGLGIADRNSLAGVVRAHVAMRELEISPTDFKLAIGSRLVFCDGTPDVLAYPKNRAAYARLTSLLTRGNLRAEKGGCLLRCEDLLDQALDLRLAVMPVSTFSDDEDGRPTHRHYDGFGAPEEPHLLQEKAASALRDVMPRLREASGGACLADGRDDLRIFYAGRSRVAQKIGG